MCTVVRASCLALLVLTLPQQARATELTLGCDAILDAPVGVTFRRVPANNGQLGTLEGLSAPVRVRCLEVGWVHGGCTAGAQAIHDGLTCVDATPPGRAWRLGRHGLVLLEGEGPGLEATLPALAHRLRFREGARHEDFVAGLDVRAPEGAGALTTPQPTEAQRAQERSLAPFLLLPALLLLTHHLLARRLHHGRSPVRAPVTAAEAATPPVHPLR